jgi:membrane-associated phospholipid phosphatase
MNIGIKDVLYRLRWFFIPYIIVLAACLLIKLTYSREEIYYAVNGIYSSWADTAAPYITDIGSGLTAVGLVIVFLMFSYRKAFIMATAFIVTSLLAQVLKYFFAAPRPKLYFEQELSKIHFVKGVEQLSLHSFPSGHTVSAFATAILIAYWCKNKLWGFPLFLLAALVGYSRMYLSQHFFEDVTVGSVLGVLVTVVWISWAENRAFLKSPKWNRGLLKK